MKVNPYLLFNGDCEAAFKLYERVLGGKITLISRFEESPMAGQTPAEWGKKILHISMELKGQMLMGSDCPPGNYEKPQGFSVSINVTDPSEADYLFAALSEGGQVKMPIQKTFWAERFGMLEDRFGIPWMVNCEAVR
jgi:PhnB protein